MRTGTLRSATDCVFPVFRLPVLKLVVFFPSPPNSLERAPCWKYPWDIQSLKPLAWRGAVRDAGSPDGAGHLLVELGSFAKRGVALAMGGFNALHQIRKREGRAAAGLGWSKGDSGEASGAAESVTAAGVCGRPNAAQLRSRVGSAGK